MAEYDLAIAGGGMVGASVALLCLRHNPHWRIALIDPRSGAPEQSRPSFDARSTALSAGSMDCLETLGLRAPLEAAAPITRVHVSDRGYLPGQVLSASDFGRAALGYVVRNDALGRALLGALDACAGIDVLQDSVALLRFGAEAAQLELASGELISARLVVVADGADSPLRERLGIGVEQSDYQQCAVIANIRSSLPHQQTAYERFTDTGPMALLPLADPHESALVWTLPPELAAGLCAGSPEAFLGHLQRRFGHRLGRLRAVSERHAYPLVRREAREQVRSRLVLVGNAAHSLHPVAGQGFNLSLRDAQILAKSLSGSVDPGCLSGLEAYCQQRRADQRLTSELTHRMVQLFTHKGWSAVTLRHLGLLSLELVPGASAAFGRQMMGVAEASYG
ncbi:2-octaprenyl-6-methoxyphenyl hydroxylase [Gilvimarinus algae]|uniref:2-octaprenyl-6-methoxyphenyl hydroxylase n=1 Tax=Gilvimarinus algae TaxID=3058037 RepID=A0ABT8TB45_9GAMM|nr:2-octaprenyl-6-methoxyphenyl hydroxylase [Gilvimarinus sp. SDUM040014]MDO3381329.1 2-octaprenyl-6-methoxyphenyl hydroxylase [Gilvimarinus sp. SDUM040014]